MYNFLLAVMDVNFRKYSTFFLLSLLGLLSGCTATTANDVWGTILKIGGLQGLQGAGAEAPVASFMRILVFILVFALLYGGLRVLIAQYIGQNVTVVIAMVLSIMSVILMPAELLVTIAGTYSILFSFLLIGSVVAFVGFLLYIIPTTNRGWRMLRLGLILILIAVMYWINKQATALLAVGAGSYSII